MIMVAVATISVVASASQCKWSFSKLAYSTAEANVANYTAYLIDNTWAKYDNAAAAAQAVATSGTSANGVIQSSGLTHVSQSGTLKLAMTTATDLLKEPGEKGYAVGDVINTYTIILDGKGNYAVVEKDDLNFNASKIVTASLTDISSAKWQSIPEPTSGLLMLLGVAGLALRRRRA